MKAAAVVVLLLLSGCASSFQGMCGFQPVAQKDGVIYGPVRCEAQ